MISPVISPYTAITLIDGYKLGHRSQYPEGTESIYSNSTLRNSRLFKGLEDYDNKYVNFGLQSAWAELLQLFHNTFFGVAKEEVIAYYKRRVKHYLGDEPDVSHIEALHDLGYLPLELRALPEGARVPVGLPNFTLKETKKEFFWLVNYLETYLQDETWQPIVAATTGYEFRRLGKKFADETCDDELHLPFQFHDFSMRGMEGYHAAAKSSAGHLLGTGGFGTDTLPAVDFIEHYYNADVEKEPIAFSVNATEHSTVTANIQYYHQTEGMTLREAETATFKRLITEVYPKGIVSLVSDSYDYWETLTVTARDLKDVIEAREEDALGNAKVVFRPDSGKPEEIVNGLPLVEYEDISLISYFPSGLIYDKKTNKYYNVKDISVEDSFKPEYKFTEASLAEAKGSLEVLWEIFGGTINSKGYRVLNPRVGLIYGDGITLERAQRILKGMKANGFASSNIVFGVGLTN